MHLDTAALCAVLGAAAGWFVPALIARLPEPVPASDPKKDAPPKEPYADMARLPGLAWKSALASGLAAGLVGLVLGWVWPLAMWVFLAPVGTALAVVDARVWLLPTRVIWPSLGVVAALGVLAAVAEGEPDDLLRAAFGLVIAFVLFYVLWMLPGGGMGYGDVRLSTVLGFALGYLGWGELAFGLWTGFVLGAVGWIPLRALRLTKSKRFPFGPFMLVGAVLGVLWGAEVGAYLAA